MNPTIWTFQHTLTKRLYVWSVVSILLGALLLLAAPFWCGVGSMFIGWGAIDAAIAFFGSRSARKKEADTLPGSTKIESTEARNLRRILLVNTCLDVLYIAAGVWMVFSQLDPFWRGGGWGVIIQGGFLFVFDLFHTLKCPHP